MTYLDPQPNDEHADHADEREFKRECHTPPRWIIQAGNRRAYPYDKPLRFREAQKLLRWMRENLFNPEGPNFFWMRRSGNEDEERDWDNLEREENENV